MGLSSPVAAFLDERCEFGPDYKVEVGALYDAYRRWSDAQGRPKPLELTRFGKDLTAARPDVEKVRPRKKSGGRPAVYRGLRLR